MDHTRDYSILMTLVAKLYNVYNSMKSRRIFGPIEAIEILLLTLLEPAKFMLIFQVWPALVTKGAYIFLVFVTNEWTDTFHIYILWMPWILFHERCYGMEYTVSSRNMHLLIAVTERVIYTSLFLLSPNKMKFIDLLLANVIHILWLNKALKMKIFCPSHEVYRSKLNEPVTLRCLQTLKRVYWLVHSSHR